MELKVHGLGPLWQALSHGADPARAVAEAERVLAPGGRVVVPDRREHDQRRVRDNAARSHPAPRRGKKDR